MSHEWINFWIFAWFYIMDKWMMKQVIENMSILAMDGGLWGDFTTNFLGITIFAMWNTCLEQTQWKNHS